MGPRNGASDRQSAADAPVMGPGVGEDCAVVDSAGNELLAVGTAQKITTNAQGYVDLIKDWRDMAIQVKQYLLWASIIGAHPNITPPDVKLLERARAQGEQMYYI